MRYSENRARVEIEKIIEEGKRSSPDLPFLYIEEELGKYLRSLDDKKNEVVDMLHSVIVVKDDIVHYYTIVYREPKVSPSVKRKITGPDNS